MRTLRHRPGLPPVQRKSEHLLQSSCARTLTSTENLRATLRARQEALDMLHHSESAPALAMTTTTASAAARGGGGGKRTTTTASSSGLYGRVDHRKLTDDQRIAKSLSSIAFVPSTRNLLAPVVY